MVQLHDPFGPCARDIQHVGILAPGEYAIYGAYTEVRVTLVEVIDRLGHIVLNWITVDRDETLTAQTALLRSIDLVRFVP